MRKPKSYNLLIPVFFVLLFIATKSSGQTHYHYENFFNDSAFINKHRIKVLTMRIPQLERDSSKNFFAYQKLCFNPYGKLAWYERDSVQNNVKRRYYTHLYYNASAQNYKTRIYERCSDIDSLREEINYLLDGKFRVLQETHFKIFIGAYYEWAEYHDWSGDSMHIKYDDFELRDTSFLVNGRVQTIRNLTEQNDYVYDEQGRLRRITLYAIDEVTQEKELLDETSFEYEGARLTRVSSKEREINFTYNAEGLPIKSVSMGKNGERAGFEIFYDYEYTTDGAFSTNETK